MALETHVGVVVVYRLLIAPWSSASVAARCSNRKAFVASLVVTLAATSSFWGVAGAGVGEPYRDLAQYFLTVLKAPLLMAPILGLGSSCCILALLYVCSIPSYSFPKPAAYRRLVCLFPLTLAIPYFVWLFAQSLAGVQSTSFGIWSGKPSWLMSPLVTYAGSVLWIPVILALATTNAIVAIRRLRGLATLEEGSLCHRCGYNLTGLTEPRCPECFKEFDPLTVPSLSD